MACGSFPGSGHVLGSAVGRGRGAGAQGKGSGGLGRGRGCGGASDWLDDKDELRRALERSRSDF